MTTNTPEDIKRAVLGRYSAHARKRLEALEQTATPCCPPQTQTSEPSSSSCCGEQSCGDPLADVNMTAQLYADDELKDLPEEVLSSLGCGNPTAIAGLREGETVLDLGSGGGLDCFLAAKKVGPAGSVIGVDMNMDMLQLARRNAENVGASNVQFRLGEMEILPLADESVDVIISNCVINLSPDKDAVLREAFRVLRRGGRLRVSDIVWAREPTQQERDDLASWTACVAGAMTADDFTAKLLAAGFRGVRIERKDDGGEVGNLYSAYISAEKSG